MAVISSGKKRSYSCHRDGQNPAVFKLRLHLTVTGAKSCTVFGPTEVDDLAVVVDAVPARLPNLPAAEHRAEQSSHLSVPLSRIHPIRAQQLLAGQSYHHSATIPGMSEVAYGSSFLILDKLIDPFFYQTQEGGSNDNCL